jgi:hypothetical protein
LDIPVERGKKIAQRKHWHVSKFSPALKASQRAHATTLANASQSLDVPNHIEMIPRILAQYGDRTKLGLARSACSASETLAEYDGKRILNAQTAIAMEQVSRTADRVHGWSAERAKPLVQIANVTLPSAAEREDRERTHRALDDIARALKLRD